MAIAPQASCFTLDNGLQVVVLPQHALPLVAVHVAYRCGSADEPHGRHGLAHLYEHLMYSGSAGLPGLYLVRLLEAGATDLNGRTTRDSTHYFETVPSSALEFTLRAEADRMGHLQEAVDGPRLALQASVVCNELRQRRAQADAELEASIAALCFPAPHPYAHDAGGLERDVAATALDDVRGWAQAHYRPGNAVLVLVGDCQVADARRLVQGAFGALGNPPAAAGFGEQKVVPAALAEHPEPGRMRRAIGSGGVMWNGFWRLPGDAHTAALVETLLPELRMALERCASRYGLSAPSLNWQAGRLGGLLGLRAQISDAGGADAVRDRMPALWLELLAPWSSADAWASSVQSRRAEWSLQLESLQAQAAALAAAVLDGIALDAALDRAALVESIAPDHRLSRLAVLWQKAPCELLELPRPAPTAAPSAEVPAMTAAPAQAPVQLLPETPPVPLLAPRLAPWLPRIRSLSISQGLPLRWAHLDRHAQGSDWAGARLISAVARPASNAGGPAWAQLALSLWRTVGAGARLDRWSQTSGLAMAVECVDEGLRLSVSGRGGLLAGWLDQALEALAPPLPEAALQDAAQLLSEHSARQARDRSPERLSQRALWALAQGREPLAPEATTADAAQTLQGCWAAWRDLADGAVLAVGDASGLCSESTPVPEGEMPQPHGPSNSATDAFGGRYLIDQAASACLLSLAWPLPASMETGEQRSAFQVLDALLAGAFTSQLNLRLREELGWSYGLRSRCLGPAGARMYVIQTSIAPERAWAARDEILCAVDRCRTAVSLRHVERTHRMLQLSALGRLERRSAVLDRLEAAWRLGDADPFCAEREEWQGALRGQAVLDCARRLFESPPALLVLGPAAAIRGAGVSGAAAGLRELRL